MDISGFPKYHIYCDESSQNKHRYTVIGATFCRADMAPRIAATAEHIIAPFGGTSELKWGKIKRKNFHMYKPLVTGYFQMLDASFLHYYSLVVDNNTVDHKKYNNGDHDLGFTKFLFTLLYKFSRIYRSYIRFYVYLYERTTRHTPEPMTMMLNQRANREHPRGYDPYRLVTFVNSEDSRIIQLTDIITGAIAYETNQHHLAVNAASHHIEMMRHIARCAHVPTLAVRTPPTRSGFDIWHIDFEFRWRSHAPRL